ncbi:thymidylate kinase [Colletotrichum truncatum]|uniref:Thymidylate kinase n=1 Tax=Colletotrichum truncatum TaxID=5467 RepID=A0ACC3ZGB1_COLTU|nr:thymidylate kinase [Colletotrichum truncatum]KAF6784658.1 thymidylate kinase [Colletotrichum truncatum]
MATISRQPFAPLDGARLQNLTSIKNRQNAISPVSGGKRKASDVDSDDFENVDPVVSKRAKGLDSFYPSKDSIKPSSFVLTKAAPLADSPSFTNTKPTLPRPRSLLQPKSPAAKINTGIAKSSPLSAPAGRSPTRGKRSGLLSSRRRTAGPYTRVDPPLFNLSSAAAPFSLDAALKGTITSYAARSSVASSSRSAVKELHEPEMKASWFFDIHEDTPEQEMTNMLQHGTCVLDISSDEESERKRSLDRAEGRDKENVPPVDDVSQTSTRRSTRRASEDDMIFEKERTALGEMDASEFYALGCDESSVIIVPGDEEEEGESSAPAEIPEANDIPPEVKVEAPEPISESKDVDDLMGKSTEPAAKAAVLKPIEGTGESFELWESGSAKDDAEVVAAVEC